MGNKKRNLNRQLIHTDRETYEDLREASRVTGITMLQLQKMAVRSFLNSDALDSVIRALNGDEQAAAEVMKAVDVEKV